MNCRFNAIRMLLLLVLAACSGCVTVERHPRTPYTIVEPDPQDFYYDESDERAALPSPGGTTPSPLANRVDRSVIRRPLSGQAKRPFGPDTPLSRGAQDYRRQAAEHVYKLNRDLIYQGVLPPLLQAIGVMEITVDGRGQVTRIQWLRKPDHAPSVARQMEGLARKAAPYPVPTSRSETVFTETWLWHESGKFQLHSLTEGQSSG